MKIKSLNKLVCVAFAFAGMGLAPAVHASHFTNFLDTLQSDVTSHDTSALSAKQTGALKAATSILNRRSTTLSGDVNQLAAASKVLDNAFTSDATLSGDESTALNSFIAEAQTQRNDLNASASIVTNGLPRGLSNQLTQIDAAITNAQDTGKSISTRARAVNFALTKIKSARLALSHLIKAPESLDGKSVAVTEIAAHKPVRFTLNSDHTYTNDTTTGTWSYARTSANTGTITLTEDGTSTTHVLDLVFRSSTSGKFTVENEDMRGTFVVKKS